MHANMIKTATAESASTAHGPAARTNPRADLYSGIHKALRYFMSRTLCQVGSADPGNGEELAATLDMLERLLGLCEVHLKDENEFIHPAIERVSPGSAARIAAEHVHHAEAIADLRDLAGLVADGREAIRAVALERLYRALALFVADNFQHMDYEQSAHNAVLWANYSDAQLREIEQAIVASIPPSAMAEALHWFIPALNAPERSAMLSDMQRGMPPEAFAGILQIAERCLGAPEYARLRRSLGLPVSAAG